MRLHSNTIGLVASILLVLSLSACGGGGTETKASGPQPNDFDGSYHYTAFFGDIGSSMGVSQWGAIDADGLSLLTSGEGTSNRGGAVEGPSPLFDGTVPYDVDGDHRMSWGAGAAEIGPGMDATGGMAVDGRIVAMTTTQEGSSPGLMLLSKKEGTFSVASLSGDYHVAILFRNTYGYNGALWGTATLDGVGTGSSVTKVNYAGQTGVSYESPEDSYTVSADGSATWTLGLTGDTLSGGIHAGGEIITLSGSVVEGGTSMVAVMIKKSSTASNATLDGAYHVCSMVSGHGVQWTASTSTGSSDGIGAFSVVEGTRNADGVIDVLAASTLQYTVAADGTLTTAGGLQAAEGAVSANGDFAILSGGSEEGTTPQLWILVR